MGNRLKELRLKQALTQTELGNTVGVSKQSIDSYEHGRNYPNIPVLIRIAAYFNVTTDYLLEVTDEQIKGIT